MMIVDPFHSDGLFHYTATNSIELFILYFKGLSVKISIT